MLRLPSPRTLVWIAAGLAAAGGIFILLAGGSGMPGSPATTSPQSAPRVARVAPHRFGEPEILLETVFIEALYFVPRDRRALPEETWRPRLAEALEEMRAFHRLQFSGRSTLIWRIVPDAVSGNRDGAFYDGLDTSRGNPDAWERIGEELDRRLGPLPAPQNGALNIRLVLYEGVGALGGEQLILASSGYVGLPYASSVLYHELGHVFGLEDAYEYEHGTPLDEDIMGLGRNKPIGQAYLSEKAKRGMGL